MSMTLDVSDFEKGFARIVKKASGEEAEKGLFDAANQLLRDAEEEQPYVPYADGFLRGSASVGGAGGQVHKRGQTGGAKAVVTKDEVSVYPGFNIVYAARWHELTPEEDDKINWSLPGSGRKYLESKMALFKEKYMKTVARSIELALKRK